MHWAEMLICEFLVQPFSDMVSPSLLLCFSSERASVVGVPAGYRRIASRRGSPHQANGASRPGESQKERDRSLRILRKAVTSLGELAKHALALKVLTACPYVLLEYVDPASDTATVVPTAVIPTPQSLAVISTICAAVLSVSCHSGGAGIFLSISLFLSTLRLP